jgi:hypothetical protein
MARLYFRIYLAVIGSLALFALLAAVTWRLTTDADRFGPRQEFVLSLAEQLAPAVGTPLEEQRALLRQWRERSGYDIAIFGPDGRLIAEAGDVDHGGPMRMHSRGGPGWRGRPWNSSASAGCGRSSASASLSASRPGPSCAA